MSIHEFTSYPRRHVRVCRANRVPALVCVEREDGRRTARATLRHDLEDLTAESVRRLLDAECLVVQWSVNLAPGERLMEVL